MKRVLINDVNAVDQVITSLKNNEIIVYPTDTYMGLEQTQIMMVVFKK